MALGQNPTAQSGSTTVTGPLPVLLCKATLPTKLGRDRTHLAIELSGISAGVWPAM